MFFAAALTLEAIQSRRPLIVSRMSHAACDCLRCATGCSKDSGEDPRYFQVRLIGGISPATLTRAWLLLNTGPDDLWLRQPTAAARRPNSDADRFSPLSRHDVGGPSRGSRRRRVAQRAVQSWPVTVLRRSATEHDDTGEVSSQSVGAEDRLGRRGNGRRPEGRVELAIRRTAATVDSSEWSTWETASVRQVGERW